MFNNDKQEYVGVCINNLIFYPFDLANLLSDRCLPACYLDLKLKK